MQMRVTYLPVNYRDEAPGSLISQNLFDANARVKTFDVDTQMYDKHLNDMGVQGWQLISVQSLPRVEYTNKRDITVTGGFYLFWQKEDPKTDEVALPPHMQTNTEGFPAELSSNPHGNQPGMQTGYGHPAMGQQPGSAPQPGVTRELTPADTTALYANQQPAHGQPAPGQPSPGYPAPGHSTPGYPEQATPQPAAPDSPFVNNDLRNRINSMKEMMRNAAMEQNVDQSGQVGDSDKAGKQEPGTADADKFLDLEMELDMLEDDLTDANPEAKAEPKPAADTTVSGNADK